MIWMAMSSTGTSDIYVHKSIQAVNQETYLKECIIKRLLPFIAKYHSNGNYRVAQVKYPSQYFPVISIKTHRIELNFF